MTPKLVDLDVTALNLKSEEFHITCPMTDGMVEELKRRSHKKVGYQKPQPTSPLLPLPSPICVHEFDGVKCGNLVGLNQNGFICSVCSTNLHIAYMNRVQSELGFNRNHEDDNSLLERIKLEVSKETSPFIDWRTHYTKGFWRDGFDPIFDPKGFEYVGDED